MYGKFIKNQDALEKTTLELERLRRSFDEFDFWVKENIEGMQYEDREEKIHRSKGYLLILRYMFQQYRTQESYGEARQPGTA